MDYSSSPKNHEGAGLWLVKVLLGPLLVLLLALHLVVNHLVSPEGLLSWADVVAYYQIPAIPLIEITFLVVVVAHAALGMRSIALDLKPTGRQVRAIDAGLIVLSLAAVGYGIWLVIRVASFG